MNYALGVLAFSDLVLYLLGLCEDHGGGGRGQGSYGGNFLALQWTVSRD